MKASDEEEYGSFYTSSRSGNGARYRYAREYSPSRGHHSNNSPSTLGGEPSPYSLPQTSASSSRNYSSRSSSSGYGSTSSRTSSNLVEYQTPQPPPCCHQFYHPPPPPIPLHSSPSHFNTVPHPPLQYRDVPACATLNRSCYGRRGTNHGYTTSYYSGNEGSPYTDPRSDIYYTSTLTRHPRHSSTRGYPPQDHQEVAQKIYDAPAPSQGYHHPSLTQGGGQGASAGGGSLRTYGVVGTIVPGIVQGISVGGPQGSSILRLDEPRIYSSSTLQLGSNTTAALQRSNSPQHLNFIDRSISLIRLDNSGAVGGAPAGPNPGNGLTDNGLSGSVTLSSGGAQPRFVIKFTPDMQSQQAQRTSQNDATVVGSNLVKTAIELGSNNDPLALSSLTPNKKFKPSTTILENGSKPVVEMSDKAVMTSQGSSEQWSLLSSGSEQGRRVSIGATSPPGNSPPPAPTLSGGVPDLLPTCILRHGQEYQASNPWRNSGNNLLSSPRRSYHSGIVGGAGASCASGPSSSRGCSSKNNMGTGGAPMASSCSQSHHYNPIANPSVHQPICQGHNNVSTIQQNQPDTKWLMFKRWLRGETKTFFGLDETTELKEEWLSRRKRFASRRYSERNVDSMPPPSPYQPPHLHGHAHAHMDQGDGGRLPGVDSRAGTHVGRLNGRSRRTRKKDHVFVVYWNIIRWIFWSIRFGRTGQRVAAGAGCGSDTNPGAGSTTPGRVPLDSQMSRDRTRSRSACPNTLADLPPSVTISPQELFFDDLEDNIRNSTHHLQPPGRGLHWRIARNYGGRDSSHKIPAQLLSKVLDNSERQQFRQGMKQPTSSPSKLALIDEYEDFRPYFTYWISIVQIVILVLIMILYGLAPVGLDLHRKSSLVLVTSLSLQQMEVIQPANFWVGPSAGDMIHLGAKYAPCMRRDDAIYRRLVETRDRERQTACCIRNDNSGCVQSSRNECSIKGVSSSNLLSTWKKWTRDDGPGGRISGSVCGLDPKYCEAPASIAPYEWPDDITKWPICRKTRGLSGIATKDKAAEHMVCEVIGHPCCIGIHAKCLITTREYCRFVNGYFHEEASLCSQVSCLQDVCGMFPFFAEDHPDQFYRLISSLFLHAGLGHILITLVFHMFILRDLEKLAGPLRTAAIYLGSGIAGNLASVLLEPHRAEVGPGGGQYGLLACLLVELFHMWGMLRRPCQALGKISLVIGILFMLGFLPWVDNFAHIVGFLAGFLLSHALMPYIAFGKYSTYRKWLEVVICLSGYFAILVTLLIVFYLGVGDCEICKVLNCLPLTPDFCAEQDIDFKPSGGGINLIT